MGSGHGGAPEGSHEPAAPTVEDCWDADIGTVSEQADRYSAWSRHVGRHPTVALGHDIKGALDEGLAAAGAGQLGQFASRLTLGPRDGAPVSGRVFPACCMDVVGEPDEAWIRPVETA